MINFRHWITLSRTIHNWKCEIKSEYKHLRTKRSRNEVRKSEYFSLRSKGLIRWRLHRNFRNHSRMQISPIGCESIRRLQLYWKCQRSKFSNHILIKYRQMDFELLECCIWMISLRFIHSKWLVLPSLKSETDQGMHAFNFKFSLFMS